jgi:hypothetical protein
MDKEIATIFNQTTPEDRVYMTKVGLNPFNQDDINKFFEIKKRRNETTKLSRLKSAWKWFWNNEIAEELEISIIKKVNKSIDEFEKNESTIESTATSSEFTKPIVPKHTHKVVEKLKPELDKFKEDIVTTMHMKAEENNSTINTKNTEILVEGVKVQGVKKKKRRYYPKKK